VAGEAAAARALALALSPAASPPRKNFDRPIDKVPSINST